jgi:tetratricopeptide (TPR) repeat protein
LRALPSGRKPDELTGADLRRAVVARTKGGESMTPTPLQIPLFNGTLVETSLRIVAAVADALAHAHERGVLHRDVKPSNVMLTPNGRVLLLDFGLATTGEEVSRITRTGALVGSLPYLAPEHFSGDSPPSVAGDVYALGVTLYELLALKLPWEGSLETLRFEKLRGVAPPLHEANLAVAWDVETVCTTAMERDPERRYASALAFASDLENLLHLRPIRASRPGLMLRAHRWTQRHPAWAVAATLVVLGAGSAAGVGVRVRQQHLKNMREEQARTAAQKDRALANFRRVLDVLQRGIDRVEDPTLDDLPEIETLRKGTFEDALAVFQQFTGEEKEFPELQIDVGRSKSRLADLLRLLGRDEEAEQAWIGALATLEPLAKAQPGDSGLAFDVAFCRERLAAIAIARGDVDRAASDAETAVTAFDALLEASPDDDDCLRHVLHARLVRCVALRRAGRAADARTVAEEIGERIAGRAAHLAKDDGARLDAARILQQLAVGAAESGDKEQLGTLLARAEELMKAPFDASLARVVAQTEGELLLVRGDWCTANGDADGSLAAKTRALERFRDLHARWPAIDVYEQELATALSNLALAQHEAGMLEAAQPLLVESRELLARMIERDPEAVELRGRLAATLTNLAVVELDLAHPDEALARLNDSRAEAARLAERNPDDPRLPSLRLSAASYLAEVQLTRRDYASAQAAANEMLELAPDDPDNVRRANHVLEACGAAPSR